VSGWSAALTGALANPQARHPLAQMARQRVAERHDLSVCLPEWIGFVERQGGGGRLTRAQETGETPGPIARPVNQGGTRPARVWPFPGPGQSGHCNFTGQENQINVDRVGQFFRGGTRLHSVGVGPMCDTACAEMRAGGRGRCGWRGARGRLPGVDRLTTTGHDTC
jgi:hypothetical protein